MEIRNIIATLNKHSISNETGIPYDRLRKFASGRVKKLSQEEIDLIYNYLISAAEAFRRS